MASSTRASQVFIILSPTADDPFFEPGEDLDVTVSCPLAYTGCNKRFLDHLDLMARQYDEIDTYGEGYAHQVRGEVVATLIALRELCASCPS